MGWFSGKPKEPKSMRPMGTSGKTDRQLNRREQKDETQTRSWTLKLYDPESGRTIKQRYRGTYNGAQAEIANIAESTGARAVTIDRRS